MNKVYLSVIIPSYNEMPNLQKGVLDKIEHYLSHQKYSYEVIVVDDGSDDGSAEFVKKFLGENKNFKLVKSGHSGKSGAVTKGMLEASGEVRLFTDMDQATPIEEVEKLLLSLTDGFDIAIGSRKKERKNAPLSRKIMSRTWIVLRTIVIGLNGISDTQCGFKLFKGSVAEILFNKISKVHHGFAVVSGSSVDAGFDVELLFVARQLGYKIIEVPVVWLYVESRRVSPVKDTVKGLRDLFIIKRNSFSGKYKK